MSLLLTVRFLAELGLLATLAWGGWALGDDALTSLLWAVALPAAAAVVWGLWVAPKARQRLGDPHRLWLEVTLFTIALLAVAATQQRPAILLGVLVWSAFVISLPSRGHEPMPPQAD